MFIEVPLAIVLIASCLMTFCLIYAGGIGILAAVVPIDWRLRWGIAVLLLTPLLVLSAAEVFWMLALLALLVALQVRLANRFVLGRVTRSPNQWEALRKNRFSIATMLFVMAFLAVMIMVLKVTPALNPLAWSSHVLIAVNSAWSVVIAWLAVNARWRWWIKWPLTMVAVCLLALPLAWRDWLLPTLMMHFYGWPPEPFWTGGTIGPLTPTWSWLAVQATILLYTSLILHLSRRVQPARRSARALAAVPVLPILMLLGWTYFELLPPRPESAHKDAAHLAWERVLELCKRIEESSFAADTAKYGGWEATPVPQLESSLATIQSELDDLIQELHQPVASIPACRSDDVTQLAKIRESARALLASGKLKTLAKQPDAAMEAFQSVVRLGIKARRGGLIVDDLIGRAVASSATEYVYQTRYHVSQATRSQICTDLAQLLGELEPVVAFQERDLKWVKSQGWAMRLQVLIDNWAGANSGSISGPDYQNIRSDEVAELRLMMLELALSSYVIDHSALPETLAALVPQYLPALPVDPYAPEPQGFRYVVSDEDYQLYSVGQNRIDDQGVPNPSDPASGMIDRSVGDISLKHLVGR